MVGNRIDAREVRWRRQASLETGELGRYTHAPLRTQACKRPGTARPMAPRAYRRWIRSPGAGRSCWQISRRLAAGLCGSCIDATDIWFLSRDSETMFKSLGRCRRFLPTAERIVGVQLTGLHLSGDRAIGSGLYQKWRGTAPPSGWNGTAISRAPTTAGLITPQTSRILIVDHRLEGQTAASARAHHAAECGCVRLLFLAGAGGGACHQTKSATFISWDPSVFNQAMVEALSGYVEASAIGFEEYGDGFKPDFQEGRWNRSPVEYCDEAGGRF